MRLSEEIVFVSIDDMHIDPVLKGANPQVDYNAALELERQIVNEGMIRDPFLLWYHEGLNYLVDGFTRKEIVDRLRTESSFSPLVPSRYAEFASIEEARFWIGINQSSRRNLTDEQRTYYHGQMMVELSNPGSLRNYLAAKGQSEEEATNLSKYLAQVFKVSERRLFYSREYYMGIEKLRSASKGNSLADDILSRNIVDDQGETVLFPDSEVIKLGKMTEKVNIRTYEDLMSVINRKKGKGKKMNPVQNDRQQMLGFLQDYLSNPDEKKLKGLVNMLEKYLHKQAA